MEWPLVDPCPDEPVLDLREQFAYFDANAERLFERMLQEIADDRPLIIAEARRRLEMGYGIYGDIGWHWPTARLAGERRQEYSDGLNYLLMEARQGEAPMPWDEFENDDEPIICFEADPRLVAILNNEDRPDD